MSDDNSGYEQAATQVIDLGNQIADAHPEDDLWDIADGVLAGALQYWLFSRQPCDDPMCEECEPVDTAEKRLADLLSLTEELSRDSEYFHSPNDTNVGRA